MGAPPRDLLDDCLDEADGFLLDESVPLHDSYDEESDADTDADFEPWDQW